ncbi:acyltransferase family protein [Promethearchaeum syntrophicum]|uniref:Acyltransferase family protein n=1 Tax=Promethearchaeum syntrophicum TaxID=2594042 RepID=A0A5B9DH92_9ARCH|nr:acyltransferase family protein [Candidatus Prometheoarchaeum syntrophicum]QEE18086.1 Acyltransferase family protein [Candidatus Prometheoarchaeum syntrophicum]
MTEVTQPEDLTNPEKVKRWYGIDILRGIGIIGVILLHGIISNYSQLDELDLDNLPPLFMVLYLVDFWGGIYALISGTVNIYAIYRHSISAKDHLDKKQYEEYRWKYLFKYGFILLLLHFLYHYALGPTYHNFETKIHKYALIPGILTNGWGYSVLPERMVLGSSLSMIALNLLALGLLAFWLFKNNPQQKLKRNKRIFLILGSIFIVFAFFQIPLGVIHTNLTEAENYFSALILGLLIGYPYPFFPFFGYGCIGAYLALVLADKPTKKTLRRQLLLMIPFLIIGVIAFMLPNAFYEKYHLLDEIFMSYIMVNINIALFILFLFIAIRVADFSNLRSMIIDEEKPSKFLHFFITLGQHSLIIFLLETVVREIIAFGLTAVFPGWNDSVLNCFIFGGSLVIMWIVIVIILGKMKWSLNNKKWKKIGP